MARPGRKRNPKLVTIAHTLAERPVERVLMPDPYEPGKFVEVARAGNSSALLRVYTNGRLCGRGDAPEDAQARLLAGQRLEGIWERAGGTGAKAMDPSKVFVDTSFRYDGLTMSQDAAYRQWRAIRAFIGDELFKPLVFIVCAGESFHSYANSQYRGGANGPRRLDQYEILRRALDRLIEYFGQARGLDRAKIRAEIL